MERRYSRSLRNLEEADFLFNAIYNDGLRGFLENPVLGGEGESSFFGISLGERNENIENMLALYFEFLKNLKKSSKSSTKMKLSSDANKSLAENRFTCEKLAEIIEKRGCEKVIDYIEAIDAAEEAGCHELAKNLGKEGWREFMNKEEYRGAVWIAEKAGLKDLAKEAGKLGWKYYIDSQNWYNAINIAKEAELPELVRKAGELGCEYYYNIGKYDSAIFLAMEAGLEELAKEVGEEAYEKYMNYGEYFKAKEIAKSAKLGEEKVNLAEALEDGCGKYLGEIELPNGRKIPSILYEE